MKQRICLTISLFKQYCQVMTRSKEFKNTIGPTDVIFYPQHFILIFQFSLRSQIVNDFRDSFFSLYNHFMVLAAELMEKFLICGDCSTPIGFPHQPLCLTKSMSTPNIWKKVNFDDKFITFGMNFCFNDLLIPNGRMDILSKIASCCMKQAQVHEKTSLPLVTNSWPDRWILGNKSKKKIKEHKSIKTVHVGHKTHPINKPSIGKPSSIWTPTTSDSLPLNHQNEGFTLRHDDFN